MSIRTRAVRASHVIDLDGHTFPVVTQEDLLRAMQEVAIVLDVCGGMVTVLTQRRPTNVENQYVTTGALLEWRDRTNAKPQPEVDGPLGPSQPLADAAEPAAEPLAAEPNGNGASVLPFQAEEPLVAAPVGDGLDDVHASDLVDESALQD